MPGLEPIGTDPVQRAQVSALYGLFTLSAVMFGARDVAAIVRLCSSSFPSLGTSRVEAAYFVDEDGLEAVDVGTDVTDLVARTVSDAVPEGGAISIRDRPWATVVPLISFSGNRGYLALSGPAEPDAYELFLIDVLARQTGAALENAVLYGEVARHTANLRAINEERAEVNSQLEETVADLERRTRVHEMLIRTPSAPDVIFALTTAVCELTGLTTGIEDAFGNVESWVAPDGADEYAPMTAQVRDKVNQAALARAGHAMQLKRRLVALAKPGNETLGAISVLDLRHRKTDFESFVLEHAAVILGMEFSHRRNLVEIELRMRRHLVDDLVSGTDEVDNVVARAAAIGYDLCSPHRAVCVRWVGLSTDDLLETAVNRVTNHLGMTALSARRAGCVVLLVSGDFTGRGLYQHICEDLQSKTGSVGVGGLADAPNELAKSFDEAQHALDIRLKSKSSYGATSYDDLGIFRILAVGGQTSEIDAYVRQWLGSLIDYDTERNQSLVETLTEYLDHGGSYDLTAEALVIHRSTLRYRLRRIRELTTLDLTDVENRLNLHVATRAWRILNGT